MMKNCVLENHEVRDVQTIIEKMQAQLNNLTYRDLQVVGLNMLTLWSDGTWILCHLLVNQFAKRKNVQNIPAQRKHGQTHIENFVQRREYKKLYDLTSLPVELDWRAIPRHHNKYPSRNQEDDGREKYLSNGASKRGHLHEDDDDTCRERKSTCGSHSLVCARSTRGNRMFNDMNGGQSRKNQNPMLENS